MICPEEIANEMSALAGRKGETEVQRRQRPSPRRVPMSVVEQVIGLYQERYQRFNVKHFHEKLVEQHQVQLSQRN